MENIISNSDTMVTHIINRIFELMMIGFIIKNMILTINQSTKESVLKAKFKLIKLIFS